LAKITVHISIDPIVHEKAKKLALLRDVSFSSLVESLLRRAVRDVEDDVLNKFLGYECDGFQSIKVENHDPLVLVFKTWDNRKFRLKVSMIEEALR